MIVYSWLVIIYMLAGAANAFIGDIEQYRWLTLYAVLAMIAREISKLSKASEKGGD